jgi:hypothetical protein
MKMFPLLKYPSNRFLILLSCVFVSACAGFDLPGQSPNSPAQESTLAPWDPIPDDSNMQRGEIELIDVEIITVENDPSRFNLRISGALPTPCHLLRVESSSPDESSNINVEIYSIVDPDQICIQVLEPFSEEIPLGVFTNGEYRVIVNEMPIGDIKP